MRYNFEKYRPGEADTMGEPYDYKSIMHYGQWVLTNLCHFFVKNIQKIYLEPLTPIPKGNRHQKSFPSCYIGVIWQMSMSMSYHQSNCYIGVYAWAIFLHKFCISTQKSYILQKIFQVRFQYERKEDNSRKIWFEWKVGTAWGFKWDRCETTEEILPMWQEINFRGVQDH